MSCTTEEFKHMVHGMFDLLDSNCDGALDKIELKRVALHMFNHTKAKNPDGNSSSEAQFDEQLFQKRFEALDTDENGVVTRAELFNFFMGWAKLRGFISDL